jgi:nucleoside-diphosphate-sugar epimerase
MGNSSPKFRVLPDPENYSGYSSLRDSVHPNFQDKRVLIFGGSGFLGKYITSLAVSLGGKVLCVSRNWSSLTAIQNPLGESVEHMSLNLLDRNSISEAIGLIRPDVVVNAARSGFPRGRAVFENIWDVNVVGTLNLLSAMRGLGQTTYIHVGSSTEYLSSMEEISELNPLVPQTLFGQTKMTGSMMVQTWARGFDFPSLIVRPFTIYGPGENSDRLMPRIFQSVETGQPVNLVAKETRRDFVHAWDVASAVIRGIKIASENCPVLNIGRGESFTPHEVVNLVSNITGVRLQIGSKVYESDPIDTREWKSSVNLTKTMLNWVPGVSLEEGLRSWWKNHF